MSTQPSKEDQLNLKLTILKKGILEEREKNSQLQSENNSLKEELHNKKEFISKLQEEINVLRENTGKKQIKKFFNTFFEGEEDEESQKSRLQEEEINNLHKELSSFKEQILSFQKEKNFINVKLNEQIKKYEELKKSSELEIQEVRQYYIDKEQYNSDNDTRIESMRIIIDKLQRENIEHGKTIDTLERDNKKKVIEIEILMKGQNQLLEEIDDLKGEVHDLKKENIGLRDEVDVLTPITKKTQFKGIRIKTMNPKTTSKISLSFGEIDDNVIIYEGKQSGRVADLRYVTGVTLVNDNKITFTIKTSDFKEDYCIEFRMKYVPYVLKYFNEFTSKEEQLNGKKIKEESINKIFTKYSLGDTFF